MRVEIQCIRRHIVVIYIHCCENGKLPYGTVRFHRCDYDFVYWIKCVSISILTGKHTENREADYFQIAGERPVLQIMQVILQTFFDGGIAAQSIDLRQSSYA